jgi:hypothetical protein
VDDSAVNTGAAVDRIDFSVCAAHDDRVVANAGVEAIGAASPAHVVVATTIPEAIVSAAGKEMIPAVQAPQDVVAAIAPTAMARRNGVRRTMV